jgi:hypothetical protein
LQTLPAAVDAFAKMIGGAYNMNGLFAVNPAQLKQLGLPEQYLQAAQQMRNNFRYAAQHVRYVVLLHHFWDIADVCL